MAVDDKVIVWNYEEDVAGGSGAATTSATGAGSGNPTDHRIVHGSGHPVTAVGLVVPRTDVFQANVKASCCVGRPLSVTPP